MIAHSSARIGSALSALAFGLLAASAAYASGSYGGGSAGNQDYNLGKSIVYKKLLCGHCPLADQELDEQSAAVLSAHLEKGEDPGKDLAERERQAAIHYLKRRYGD
jgi:hypothetical protein